jgi:hypothetical protein
MADLVAHWTAFKQILLTSIIRTVVPVVVGVVSAFAASKGFSIDETAVTSMLTVAFTTVYYTTVRALESFVSTKWGRLLGRRSAPFYFEAD